MFFSKQNYLTIFSVLDYLIFFFYYFFKISNQTYITRMHYRLKNVSWNFYKKNNINFFYIYLNNNFRGILSFWVWFKDWAISIILFLVIFYYLLFIKTIIFNKILFEWFLIIMFLYWLMSGFVYFIKKYQFSKFTSVIQRFWKRSYILFWVIESGVFLIFFFLTLNATEEPVYMYDQMKLYKDHLFSWRWFIIKLLPGVTLIIIGYYVKNLIKWNIFTKQIWFILLITLILLYVLWLEFYQFFHIINFYSDFVWVFDYDEFLWNLELEFRRTRMANNYVAVCMMAKFWHLVFIFVFWVFFLLRINEINRVRYFLLSANLQNFIILYVMTWLYMYPWLKFLFRGLLDVPFYWFILNNRRIWLRIFFNDIKLYYFSICDCWVSSLNGFNLTNFYYFNEASSLVGFMQFKKHFLKDSLIYLF